MDLGILESRKASALVVISLDSIDGTRDSPRYADPNRANPSQNARLDLSSMDGEQDRDQ